MKLLSKKQKEDLMLQLRKANKADERLRINCVLLYDENKKIEEIAAFLYLNKYTVYNYINEFYENNKTKNDDKGGSKPKLTEKEESELKEHLSKNTYLKTNGIVKYIEEVYGVRYTISGLTKALKRLGFCYKRPANIPGKLNVLKQEEFKETYSNLKQSISDEEEILFMDSVHPEYQSQSVKGWILKGEVKHLQTTAKQHRLHYTGTISLSDKNVVIHNSDRVNQDVVIEFLGKVEEAYSGKKVIHIICDNASYYKSKKVKEWLTTSRIKIHHLPGYSPNLNAIERLWKILREKVCYNRYYNNFCEFKASVTNFFNKLPLYKDILDARINDNFQTFSVNVMKIAVS